MISDHKILITYKKTVGPSRSEPSEKAPGPKIDKCTKTKPAEQGLSENVQRSDRPRASYGHVLTPNAKAEKQRSASFASGAVRLSQAAG